MICQKLCRNNLSAWGSLEVKYFFSTGAFRSNKSTVHKHGSAPSIVGIYWVYSSWVDISGCLARGD